MDPVEVGEVLYNLVKNAAKYSPPDTEIVITAQRDGDVVRVEVSDRGPGIARSGMPHLFDPLYRVIDGKPRPQGLGLGLAIVKGPGRSARWASLGGEPGWLGARFTAPWHSPDAELAPHVACEDCMLTSTVLGEPTLKLLRYQQQFSFFDTTKVERTVRFFNLGEEVMLGDLERVFDRIVREYNCISRSRSAIASSSSGVLSSLACATMASMIPAVFEESGHSSGCHSFARTTHFGQWIRIRSTCITIANSGTGPVIAMACHGVAHRLWLRRNPFAGDHSRLGLSQGLQRYPRRESNTLAEAVHTSHWGLSRQVARVSESAAAL